MHNQPPEGYLAQPQVSNGKAVLVLHAWWGLNQTIKLFCDRLTTQSFIVFAPDLYHGRIADSINDAELFSAAINSNPEAVTAEILDAARYLHQHLLNSSEGLAVIGFSMGAYFALELSTMVPEMVQKVVVYYGTGPENFHGSQAEYLAHFASNDPYEPEENVEYLQAKLKEANRPATFFVYPGTGHWFFESDREDAYNPAAAELAWERTLKFLKA